MLRCQLGAPCSAGRTVVVLSTAENQVRPLNSLSSVPLMTNPRAPEPPEITVARSEVLTEAFKGLLVANGAGAAALLALAQAVWATQPALAALALRGIAVMASGVGFALLTPIFRYVHSQAARRKTGDDKRTPYWWIFLACLALSVAAFFVSILIVVTGGLKLLGQ